MAIHLQDGRTLHIRIWLKSSSVMSHKFSSTIWNDETIAILCKLYPNTPAVDIADIIGCSDTAILYKARKLGLKRDPSFSRNNFIGRYVKKGRYKEL